MHSRTATTFRMFTPTSTSPTTSPRSSTTRSSPKSHVDGRGRDQQVGVQALPSGRLHRRCGVLFKTIDEIVAPDAVIRTPLPIDATGVEALKRVGCRAD